MTKNNEDEQGYTEGEASALDEEVEEEAWAV